MEDGKDGGLACSRFDSGPSFLKARNEEMISSHLRGHEIEQDKKQDAWMFSDTREPTVDTHKDRPCAHCGQHSTPEGHDACLGTLPGVMNACCGHGHSLSAYVQFGDGRSLSGNAAIDAMGKLKRRKPCNKYQYSERAIESGSCKPPTLRNGE